MANFRGSHNPSGLSSLPQELLRLILSHCSDIHSLLFTVASCRAFYGAFHSFPSPLIDSVLHRELDCFPLPEVIRATRARRLCKSSLSKQELSEARKQLLQREPETSLDWTVSEGIIAVQLRNSITDLSRAICKEYLDNLESHVGNGHEEPPSDDELRRIQQALYRFETYCNTFPPLGEHLWPNDDVREEWTTFFDIYQPWEIEQLGSVHEALFRLLAPVFNDCALHDISWAWDEVRYARDYDDGHVEWLLSGGLRYLSKILKTADFHDRWVLIGGREAIHHECNWLYETFQTYKNLFLLRQSGRESGTSTVTKSRDLNGKESISTVERLWEWSHVKYYESWGEQSFRCNMAMEDHFRSLRACGYVFWDENRLTRIGWFNQSVHDLDLDIGEEIYKNAPSLRSEERSWIIRSGLYQEGKRGYWDGDPDTTAIDPSQEWRLAAFD